VARIRQSRRAAEKSLSRIDSATADTWEDVKTRVNRSVEDLAEAVEGAMPK
jgi:gas vesicle protein